MRAADADRQAVADRLRGALDEGRLDLTEYDDRLQRTYQAKTYGELAALLADLPATAPAGSSRLAPVAGAAAAPAATGGRYPGATSRWLADMWNSYLTVVAICVTIWFFSMASGDGDAGFWPIWVIGPWGLLLAWYTVTGLVSGEPQRWAAKQEKKRQAKAHRRGRCGAAPVGGTGSHGC